MRSHKPRKAAADDAAEMADRIARGQSRLFRVGLYLTVHAPSIEELDEAAAHVRATAASVLLFRQLQGWTSTTVPSGQLTVWLRPTRARRSP